jgi:hypothetical protein
MALYIDDYITRLLFQNDEVCVMMFNLNDHLVVISGNICSVYVCTLDEMFYFLVNFWCNTFRKKILRCWKSSKIWLKNDKNSRKIDVHSTFIWPLIYLAWHRHCNEKSGGAQTSTVSEIRRSCKCSPHVGSDHITK